ncbi:hypothetical protein OBBRIDRAFT_840101 [Obba rivulosa]|uniref:Uncharacterized protein n=1 Tax=Obba rivulosa TaxID=1052685 RepID=A0A8E2AGV8_9APHY|nr:hypothetical protein OBBRIDRAFT_840101 [Obba rivulosa]
MIKEPVQLGRLFRVACEREPYLLQFESNWATTDMVKQYMRNWRKYFVKCGYIKPRTERQKERQSENSRSMASTSCTRPRPVQICPIEEDIDTNEKIDVDMNDPEE